MSAKITTFLILLTVGLATPLSTFGQEDPFTELKQTFEEGTIFNADFTHQSVDSYTQDTVASEGRIWVGEEQYKVETNNQSVVVDGETSTVYDDDRNRVIISKYEPEDDDFAPSRILNGVDSTYTVQEQKVQDDETYILLTSDDPFAIYKKVEIFLGENLVPRKIEAVDPSDNIITTTFEEGAFMDLEDDLFELDYPENAELVDMRN